MNRAARISSTAGGPTSSKNLWLVGFVLAALAQLTFVAAGLSVPSLIATWILMPFLAMWVWQMGGPRLLTSALMFCWIGDVLGNPRQLGLGPDWFILSVGAFIAAIICLTCLFVLNGALTDLWAAVKGKSERRWPAGLALLYALILAATLGLVWDGLGLVLRVIAGTFLPLLMLMATTALAFDTVAAIGAALFLGSEMLIAIAIAGHANPAAISHRLKVLALYALGMLCITVGVMSRKPR